MTCVSNNSPSRPFAGIATLIAMAILLSACSSGPSHSIRKDAAPRIKVNVDAIPNPIPRAEPKSKYGNPKSYEVFGTTYYTMDSVSPGYTEKGIASWYGTKFHGRRTSSGEPYDMYQMTAAHKTLPLPSYVEVINLRNGHRIVVRVNDRGPFHEGRIIDLSYVAATKLGINLTGTAPVEIRVLDPRQSSQPRMAVNEAVEVQPLVSPVAYAATPVVNQTPLSNNDAAASTTPPQPASPVLATATSTDNSPATAGLYLQVGAFSSWGNAESLRTRLAHVATNIQITTNDDPSRPLYRVRIGPLANDQEAQSIATRLVDHGIRNPSVIID